ncbi:hypothetical protein [Sphingomonas sp. HMP6]|uniref:hypothetical protein n=1 Tax=Sphingomonas sp. HMP6 TaxID=1517551 RepID=UPI00159644C7|nr:hypothetical protein [Sphingomonas sp. HMP6]BCA57664.1 hypothetical protein HMP06_0433 [Sphingomonas sp. HMP6]
MPDMNPRTLAQALDENFKDGTLEAAVRLIADELDPVSSACLEEAANRIAAAARAARPPEPNPAGEAIYQAGRSGIDPTGADDDPEAGTLLSLTATATMLETYAVEAFPASDQGQVHFGRVLMEASAVTIRAYIAGLDATEPMTKKWRTRSGMTIESNVEGFEPIRAERPS